MRFRCGHGNRRVSICQGSGGAAHHERVSQRDRRCLLAGDALQQHLHRLSAEFAARLCDGRQGWLEDARKRHFVEADDRKVTGHLAPRGERPMDRTDRERAGDGEHRARRLPEREQAPSRKLAERIVDATDDLDVVGLIGQAGVVQRVPVSATPALAHADGAARARSIPRESISIQLFTLRELPLEATLQGLAAIGYRKVEHAGFGNLTATEFRAALRQAGLRASSGHQLLTDAMVVNQGDVIDSVIGSRRPLQLARVSPQDYSCSTNKEVGVPRLPMKHEAT